MIYVTYPLIWRQRTIDKIWQKHQLSPEEVEEAVFDDEPICHKGPSNSYCIYGRAMSGRYLFIILREKNRGAQYRVITARDMQDKEKRYYKKHQS